MLNLRSFRPRFPLNSRAMCAEKPRRSWRTAAAPRRKCGECRMNLDIKLLPSHRFIGPFKLGSTCRLSLICCWFSFFAQLGFSPSYFSFLQGPTFRETRNCKGPHTINAANVGSTRDMISQKYIYKDKQQTTRLILREKRFETPTWQEPIT